MHARRFIELSPFLVLATSDRDDNMDASRRGGAPGFVKVNPDGALLIPDAPGNNRLDSLLNTVDTGKVGALFLIPGFDETLRVNGSALLSQDPAEIAQCTDERRTPKLVIRIAVTAVYLHCAKAFLRSSDASSGAGRHPIPPATPPPDRYPPHDAPESIRRASRQPSALPSHREWLWDRWV